MRAQSIFIFIAAIVVLSFSPEEQKPGLSDLEWILGNWMEDDDKTVTKENFRIPAGIFL